MTARAEAFDFVDDVFRGLPVEAREDDRESDLAVERGALARLEGVLRVVAAIASRWTQVGTTGEL